MRNTFPPSPLLMKMVDVSTVTCYMSPILSLDARQKHLLASFLHSARHTKFQYLGTRPFCIFSNMDHIFVTLEVTAVEPILPNKLPFLYEGQQNVHDEPLLQGPPFHMTGPSMTHQIDPICMEGARRFESKYQRRHGSSSMIGLIRPKTKIHFTIYTRRAAWV
jgi:hypothetical protein